MKRRRVGRREERKGVKEAAVGDKRTTVVAAAERGGKGRWARGGEVRARLVGNALSKRERGRGGEGMHHAARESYKSLTLMQTEGRQTFFPLNSAILSQRRSVHFTSFPFLHLTVEIK